MNISIIGTGYVGLVSGVGFAEMGHQVTCVDIDEEKVEMINRGEPPIYEKGLDVLLKEMVSEGRLKATTDTEEAVKNTGITFICVGTPSKSDGDMDLSAVRSASEDIAEAMADKDGYHVVCVKSTVVPGTTEEKVLPILEKSGRKVGEDFGLGMNPEFLREGVALDDFLHPDRIVIGGYDKRSTDKIVEAYEGFQHPKLTTNIRTAEMIKYVSNSLLATKISFANEISRLCEKVGVDVYEVMDGVGMDHRIKRDFLNAGAGFGGSCFPKDVKALVELARYNDIESKILQSVLEVNESQPLHVVEMLEMKLGGLEGKKVALLGLSFKAGTDDTRETRALPMAREMVRKGAVVVGYDPMAMDEFAEEFPEMKMANSVKEALDGADGCMIQNDWDEFKELESEDLTGMKRKLVVDGRRILDPEELGEEIEYVGVGLG